MAKKTIPQSTVATNNIGLLPNKPTISAAALKGKFDQFGVDDKTFINNTINVLQDSTLNTSGSFTIGHRSPNLTSDNTGDALEEVRNIAVQAQAGTIADNSLDYVKLNNATKNAVVPYGVATNSGNNYTVDLSPGFVLADGCAFSFKCNADSSGNVNINPEGTGSKPLVKSNGTAVNNIKANGVYTARYNVTTGNFILQGEGGSGNALASDLLAGKTATTDAGDITGTMPNQSGTVKTGTSPDISGTNVRMFPPAGYYDGATRVQASDTDLIAGNIKSGVNIFGLIGTLPDGTGLKRKATLTITSNSAQSTYQMLSGGQKVAYDLVGTGFSFLPNIIVVIRDRGAGQNPRMYTTIYSRDSHFDSPFCWVGSVMADDTQLTQNVGYNPVPITASNGYFVIPVNQESAIYKVVVYE
jgi:hypothetical protein